LRSTILIVDDEPSARETLISILEGHDYLLELASTGIEALEVAERVQPDLILLDVMMPRMNGFETCRRIRSNPKLAEVPIIMLTALDDHASLLKGIESGADDFCTKPIERQELITRVRTITRLNRYRTLMEQRENLRKMAERVLISQEEERKIISRDLHDDLGQTLTAHLLDLRNLREDFSAPGDELFKRLQSLQDQFSEVFSIFQRLAKDLRPNALDALGLISAIQVYCTEFTSRTRMPVHLEITPTFPTLSDLYSITLYRALQESLTNIIKHAQASQVWVELSVEDEMIVLIVQDNGGGFETDQSQSNGIGLTGLKERLTLAGGKLTTSSSKKRGTIISAHLPLSEPYTTGRSE